MSQQLLDVFALFPRTCSKTPTPLVNALSRTLWSICHDRRADACPHASRRSRSLVQARMSVLCAAWQFSYLPVGLWWNCWFPQI